MHDSRCWSEDVNCPRPDALITTMLPPAMSTCLRLIVTKEEEKCLLVFVILSQKKKKMSTCLRLIVTKEEGKCLLVYV